MSRPRDRVPMTMSGHCNYPSTPGHDGCGRFGLHTYRHRLFETTFRVEVPEHAAHDVRTAKMGRPAADDEYMHIVGNFSGVERARHIMGMPWANRDGLREAIPTAYAEFIGRQLLDALVLQSIDGESDG